MNRTNYPRRPSKVDYLWAAMILSVVLLAIILILVN